LVVTTARLELAIQKRGRGGRGKKEFAAHSRSARSCARKKKGALANTPVAGKKRNGWKKKERSSGLPGSVNEKRGKKALPQGEKKLKRGREEKKWRPSGRTQRKICRCAAAVSTAEEKKKKERMNSKRTKRRKRLLHRVLITTTLPKGGT